MLKKISEEVVHENPWWKVVRDEFELPDGKHGQYYYGANPGEGMAMVVPFMDDGKLLLSRQYRYLKNAYSIQFPGGGMDAGETALQTAVREFREETGYEAGELIAVGEFESSSGMIKDAVHVFLARSLVNVGGKIPEPTGEIELLTRRPDEFEDMISRGEIWDGQTLAAWLLVRKHILSE